MSENKLENTEKDDIAEKTVTTEEPTKPSALFPTMRSIPATRSIPMRRQPPAPAVSAE